MNLVGPQDWTLEETTRELLADLDESAYQINELRPLVPEILLKVKEQLLGERVYSSNAIEGNLLSLRETSLILQTHSVLGMARKREAQEALNLAAASREIDRMVSENDSTFSVDEFCQIHGILMKYVSDGIAGRLRDRDVMIRGVKYQPPDSSRVPDLMDRLFRILAEQTGSQETPILHPLALATWAHWAIARIHPFEDKNGRMARLWQDLLLLRSRLTVAIIRPEDRNLYYDALSSADEGDCNPLIQLVSRRVLSTMQVYLSAQEEADELKTWAAELAREVSVRELERRRLEYERWRHIAERVLDAFERCARAVSSASNRSFEVQIRRFDLIDQAAWESLRAGGGAKRTWFFRVGFRRDQIIIWYIFFFERHGWTEADEGLGVPGPLVGMHISEQKPGDERAFRLEAIENIPLSLRELVIIDKRLLRQRQDLATSSLVYDEISPIRAAQEFIEEVVSKRLLS